jgi:membrane-associated protease RseP (regulator of RpoE activity)
MPERARTLAILAAVAALPFLSAPVGADEADGPRFGGGRIGVHVQGMTPELRQHFQAPPDRGLLVTRVEPGQPAERAGVKVGDVILEAGGEAQRDTWDLVRVVGRAPEGEKLPLRVLRDGKTRTLEVVPVGVAAPWPDPQGIAEWIERGMQMGSEELREHLRELERRLEELERRMEEERLEREGAERT